MNKTKKEKLEEVVTGLCNMFEKELFKKTEEELKNDFYYPVGVSPKEREYYVFEFFWNLEIYKMKCESWEEKHNGSTCIVERVRDKYIMPRIKELLEILDNKGEKLDK